jgi:hypothetical protein
MGSSSMVRAATWQHCRIAGKSLEPSLPTQHGNIAGGQGNDLGYGKNVKDWIIRSQAPKGIHPMEKVQRLGGSGLAALADGLR